MSRDLNHVVLVGRLVRDPEIRYTPSNMAVSRFAVANGERIKQGNDWKDHANYFDVVVWGNQAVNCEKYLKKGSQVAVDGTLRQNRWNDPNGQARSKIEIIVNSIQFLSPAGQASAGGGSQQYNQTPNSSDNRKTQSAAPQNQQSQVNEQFGFNADPWGDSSAPSNDFDPGAGFSDDDIPF